MLSCFSANGSDLTNPEIDSCPKDRNGWDGPKLRGNVKSVTAELYEITEEFAFADLVSYTIYTFDPSHGNCLEKKLYIAEELDEKYTYSYDSNGNCIEMIKYIPGVECQLKTSYIYDSQGKLIEKKINPNEEHEVRVTYLYDSKGNLVKSNLHEDTGEICNSDTYAYDSNGNMIEHFEGEWGTKCIYEYDSDGNCIAMNYYDSDGQLTEEYQYEYDSYGNRISETLYYEGYSSYYLTKFLYDSHGNCIEEKNYSNIGYIVGYDRGVKYKIEYFE
jgi:YD repeat-containing protein